MSQDKQMKAVSPLYSKSSISHLSSVGRSLIFCIWAYQAGVLQSKETLSAFIQQAGVWGHHSLSFTDSTNRRSDHSGSFDLSGWGLYLRPHHRDYL